MNNTTVSRDDVAPPRSRQAKALLLALFGEFVVDRVDGPVRASILIDILDGAGVAAPTTRATLARMTRGGFLKRVRLGREIGFSLSEDAAVVLREAADRVHAQRPFDPKGSGWTLVTFSVPEAQRRVRHRLRSSLAWEGFAPLRDGLWLAAGEVNLDAALEPLADALVPHAVTAFRAVDLPTYPVSRSVREAWDIDAIRAEHEEFLATWSRVEDHCPSELSEFVCLIADWLSLLRSDPCLPAEFLESTWPAESSVALYQMRRAELAVAARAQFCAAVEGPRELVGD